MGLQLAIPPPGADELLKKGLDVIGNASPAASLTQLSPPLRTLDFGSCHPAYFLDLAATENPRPLASVKRVGWRFLVTDSGRTIAAVELLESNGGLEFQQIERGPFVAATDRALAAAQDSPIIADGVFEPRLLRVPALYLMIVWLKNLRASQDRFIFLDPGQQGSTNPAASPLKDEAEFLAALRSAKGTSSNVRDETSAEGPRDPWTGSWSAPQVSPPIQRRNSTTNPGQAHRDPWKPH